MPMPKQQTIWTVLPNGLKSGTTRTLKLSVLLSPRLTFDGGQTSGTLDQFRPFLNWPEFLAGIRLGVTVVADGAAPVTLPARIVTDPPPDPVVWKALFNARTVVRAHDRKPPREPISYYDPTKMEASLYRGYGAIGQETPYRVSESGELKRAFQTVHRAFAPDPAARQPIHARLADLDALSREQLIELHHDLGKDLLRQNPDAPFSTKLADTIRVAGRLARMAEVGEPVALVPETADPVSAFAQFAAFHRRLPRSPARTGQPADPGAQDREEFHHTLSALGEYPALLRQLGLLIDAEIAHDDRLESLYGRPPKRLLAVPTTSGPTPYREFYAPATRYIYDVRSAGSPLPFPVFAAAPRGAAQATLPAAPAHNLEIVGGLLNLAIRRIDGGTGRKFDLVQTDLDGALSKVMNAVKAIVLEERRPGLPVDQSKLTAAPAFRTGGVALVQSGRALALGTDIQRAGIHEAAMHKGEPAEFDAEDLIRGYRIDIRRFPRNLGVAELGRNLGTDWLSLHKRVGAFTFRDAALSHLSRHNMVDEGFIQPAIVQDPARSGGVVADDTDPVYVPESLFHWKGWSLAAPPPAKPTDVAPVLPSSHTTLEQDTLGLDIAFGPAPNSLPRLRFGDWYQVRARTVDLAGNGPSVDAANLVLETLSAHGHRLPVLFEDRPEFFRYRRFEPVNASEMVPRNVLAQGEALEVLVIRGNGFVAPDRRAAEDPRYNRLSERHIVPPKAALTTVEAHGLLDGAFGQGGNPGRFYNLCKKENGTLNDKAVINIQTGRPEPLPNVVVVDPASGAVTTIPNGIRFVRVQESGTENGYTVHYEEQLRLPYLPDPMARGAALFGLPGVDNTAGQLDANGELQWGAQVLAIPATRDLGFVTKIDFGPAEHWPMHLPFRLSLEGLPEGADLVLPCWDKANRQLTVRLPPGETKTIWIGSYPDGADVDLFGLHAWWRKQVEPADDGPPDEFHFLNMAQHGALAMLTPVRKVTLVHAVQRPVKPPIESSQSRLRPIRFKGDTIAYFAGAFEIHPQSTAKVDLLAAWEEPTSAGPRIVNTHVFEFPIHLGSATAEPSDSAIPIASLNLDTNILEFRSPPPESVNPPAERYLARHEFGDTKHRKITYRLVATSRYREYFPADIKGDADKLTTTFEKQLIIRSSARPAPPEISHIVPTFGWTTETDGDRITQSARRGGGLRVYLGATWYSSGEGEQLAVIDASGLNKWGLDPVRATASTTARPIKPDVLAASAPDSEYDQMIYPYDVHYDAEQALWYSDISFRVGSAYFPFKQIVLARYQRYSLNGAHLSTLVHAGIHQLAPDRILALAYSPPGATQRKIGITVSAVAAFAAPLGTSAAAVVNSTVVEVSLEERDGARLKWDADLGWTLAAAEHQPVAAAARFCRRLADEGSGRLAGGYRRNQESVTEPGRDPSEFRSRGHCQEL